MLHLRLAYLAEPQTKRGRPQLHAGPLDVEVTKQMICVLRTRKRAPRQNRVEETYHPGASGAVGAQSSLVYRCRQRVSDEN